MLRVDRRFPQLELVDSVGKRFSIRSMPQADKTVVVIFHPDCVHCHALLKALSSRSSPRTTAGAQFALVAVSIGDSVATARFDRMWPELHVGRDPQLTLVRKWGVRAVPMLVVLDRNSIITHIEEGWGGDARLSEMLATN